jgi:hypothetical protein
MSVERDDRRRRGEINNLKCKESLGNFAIMFLTGHHVAVKYKTDLVLS